MRIKQRLTTALYLSQKMWDVRRMRANIQYPECGILGMAFLTDYPPVVDLLTDHDTERFNTAFPGLIEAVLNGMKELGNRRLKADVVTYFNFRVQVLALGFDADPAPACRVIPAGILTEDDSVGESIH